MKAEQKWFMYYMFYVDVLEEDKVYQQFSLEMILSHASFFDKTYLYIKLARFCHNY